MMTAWRKILILTLAWACLIPGAPPATATGTTGTTATAAAKPAAPQPTPRASATPPPSRASVVPPTRSSTATRATAKKPAGTARSSASAPATKRTATRRTAAPARKAAPRTLEEVDIAGEIPVPQVLFVTAREPRRDTDFQHARFRPSALELGRSVPLPARLAMDRTPTQATGTP